jgi:hypothetical protein
MAQQTLMLPDTVSPCAGMEHEDTSNVCDHEDDHECEDCKTNNRVVLAIAMYVKWVMEQVLTSNMHRIRYSGTRRVKLLSMPDLVRGAKWVLRVAEKQNLSNDLDPNTMNIRHPGYLMGEDELAIQVTWKGVESFPGLSKHPVACTHGTQKR